MNSDDDTLKTFDDMLNHELPPPINKGDILREEDGSEGKYEGKSGEDHKSHKSAPSLNNPRWLEIVRGLCFLPVLIILAIRDWFRGDLDRSGEPVKSEPKLPLCPDFDDDCQGVKDCHLCSCYHEGLLHNEPEPQVHCIELDHRRDQYHLELDQFRNQ